MVDTAAQIWDDYNTTGVPASGVKKPVKSKIREWGSQVEAGITTLSTITNKAAARANLGFPVGDVVADYGAVPNSAGATSANNAAFAAAIAAAKLAGGGVITVPPGRFYLSAALVFDFENFTFEGAGRSATILDFQTLSAGVNVYTGFDISIGGFSILNTSGDGLVIGETTGPKTFFAYSQIFDIATKTTTGRGIAFGKCYMVDVWGLRAQSATGIGIDMSTGFKTTFSVSDCHSFDGLSDAWKIKNCAYSTFKACGADNATGYGYWLENLSSLEMQIGAETCTKAAMRFNYDSATTDTVKGFSGLKINCFEDLNDSGATTASFAHFVSATATSYAGEVIFDGCSHFTTPSGNSMKIDSGNYRIIMPRSRNRIKRAVSGGSYSVIADGANDVPNGQATNITGANTPIAQLRPKLCNGISSFGGVLTIYATSNKLDTGARGATYHLIVTRSVGVSGLTLISSAGDTAGANTDSASFTFSLDTGTNQLKASPVGSTATGNYYFHITAVGNIDVEPL